MTLFYLVYKVLKIALILLYFTVLERPSSQMSYLDQFLKETNSSQQSQQQFEGSNVHGLLYQGGSMESEDGDIEDNRALSIASSKSNLSELSLVRFIALLSNCFS